jgi:hypothetical protein
LFAKNDASARRTATTDGHNPLQAQRERRKAHAARFNYDLDAIVADIKERQRTPFFDHVNLDRSF